MPFESNAQRKFMFAKKPAIAKEFEAKTPENVKLPGHVLKMADGGLVPEGNWQQIKDWVVSHASTDDSKPQHNMADGGVVPMDPGIPGLPGVPELPGIPRRHPQPQPQPRGYDEGGQVPQDMSGQDFLSGITSGAIPMQGASQPAPAAPPAALPAAPPVGAGPTPQAQANSIIGDPKALAAQRAQAINPGVGGIVGMGIAGLGDALARSYGHDQSANALGNVQKFLSDRGDKQLKNIDASQNDRKERFGLEQTISAKDPNSDLSKIAQQTYGALLAKSGFKPQDISKMPASLIADLTGKNVDQIKAESEAKMAAASLGLKEVTEKANVEHQKAEESNQATERSQEAAKTLAGRSTLQKVTDAISGLLPGGNPAIQTLQNQLPGAAKPPIAASINQPHPQDAAAIQWAQAHPNDPRAAQILKLHGVQ